MKPTITTTGITAGAFDLCHAGHILMFKEAKEQCDYLCVGLHEDPSVERSEKNKPKFYKIEPVVAYGRVLEKKKKK